MFAASYNESCLLLKKLPSILKAANKACLRLPKRKCNKRNDKRKSGHSRQNALKTKWSARAFVTLEKRTQSNQHLLLLWRHDQTWCVWTFMILPHVTTLETKNQRISLMTIWDEQLRKTIYVLLHNLLCIWLCTIEDHTMLSPAGYCHSVGDCILLSWCEVQAYEADLKCQLSDNFHTLQVQTYTLFSMNLSTVLTSHTSHRVSRHPR